MESRANILVVDDDLGPRESMRMILKPLHNVFIAEDGEAALRAIQEKEIDLVTLDLKMPGMSGIEVLREIKKISPTTEVIIVTGYGTLKTATEAMRYGVNSYITKPYNLNEITSLIDKAIERRRFNLKLKHFFKEALSPDKVSGEAEVISPPTSESSNAPAMTEELIDETESKLKKMKEQQEDFSKEIKILEERLIRSERLSLVGQLAAGYAHDLNNSLTAVKGYTELVSNNLEEHYPELSEVRAKLRNIYNQIELASSLTENLLDIARETSPEKVPTDIKNLINKVLSYIEYRFVKRGIAIHKQYGLQLPLVSVDPRKMEQVFLNLIINAYQAMPEGGTLTITVNRLESRKGEAVVIAFEDTGHGISQENLKRIFDPFFTTKNGSGTGLGLFISRRIVESFQGSLEALGAEDKGATFLVTLPAVR